MMKHLGKLRRDAGLSQHALGNAADIHRWRISHAELGMVDLTPDETSRIRRVLLDAARRKSARVLKELEPGA
jgi:predicted transcriptional regulator